MIFMENVANSNLIYVLITAIFIGASAGYLGSFMILRKMALVGDAMSHVALPGIALAIMFSINPFVGAFLFLLLATFLIWILEAKTTLSTETLVGVLFTASLAVGILIIPDQELIEALFGDISKVNFFDTVASVVFSLLTVFFAFKIRKQYILGTISKDLARSNGINVDMGNLAYLALVSVIVALGIKIAGTLLTGALVVLPAAASKNMALNFSHFSFGAMIIGALSAALGVFLAGYLDISSGPSIVLVAVGWFILSLIKKR